MTAGPQRCDGLPGGGVFGGGTRRGRLRSGRQGSGGWRVALAEQAGFQPVLQAIVDLGFPDTQPGGDGGGIDGALRLPQRQQQHLELQLAAEFEIPVGDRGGYDKDAAPRPEVDLVCHTCHPPFVCRFGNAAGSRPAGQTAPAGGGFGRRSLPRRCCAGPAGRNRAPCASPCRRQPRQRANI